MPTDRAHFVYFVLCCLLAFGFFFYFVSVVSLSLAPRSIRNENNTIKFINKGKKNYRSNDNLYSLERLQIDGIECAAQSVVDFVACFFFVFGRLCALKFNLIAIGDIIIILLLLLLLDELTENIRPNDFLSAS